MFEKKDTSDKDRFFTYLKNPKADPHQLKRYEWKSWKYVSHPNLSGYACKAINKYKIHISVHYFYFPMIYGEIGNLLNQAIADRVIPLYKMFNYAKPGKSSLPDRNANQPYTIYLPYASYKSDQYWAKIWILCEKIQTILDNAKIPTSKPVDRCDLPTYFTHITFRQATLDDDFTFDYINPWDTRIEKVTRMAKNSDLYKKLCSKGPLPVVPRDLNNTLSTQSQDLTIHLDEPSKPCKSSFWAVLNPLSSTDAEASRKQELHM